MPAKRSREALPRSLRFRMNIVVINEIKAKAMFKNIIKDPKTSIIGLSPVLGAIVNSYIPGQYHEVANITIQLLMAAALLVAKDPK